jgi:hypothetical protein
MSFLWKFLYQEFKAGAFTAKGSPSSRQASINKAKVFEIMKTLKNIFVTFARALIMDQSFTEYEIDLKSGHMFHIDKAHCNCGLIQLARPLTDPQSKLNVFEATNLDLIDFETVLEYKVTDTTDNVELLDCSSSKLNCLRIAQEIIVSILQVGVFIHD